MNATRIFPAILAACLALAAAGPLAGESGESGVATRDIGLEGRFELVLEHPHYQPRPLDDRTPLILRIEDIAATPDGRFRYDFRYIGFEPGPLRLADFLILPDGSPATDLGETEVILSSILPDDHQGALTPYLPNAFPAFGGYRNALVAFAAVWTAGLLAMIWFGRRRKPVVETAPPAPPPTYAERMRPLVEAAAAGDLAAAGQAELERLMTGFWREKLGLESGRMTATLATLKQDPEAGELLRALERWLHRPGGASPAEIRALLDPYRTLPLESEAAP